MNSESLSCSLEGPDLIKRIGEWSQLMSRATSRRAERGRIVTTYPREQDVLDQLHELIAAEAQCCSFMHFNVQEHPDEVVVELTVPDEMSEALSSMFGLLEVEPSEATAS